MPSQNSIITIRTDDYHELTSLLGTENAAITTSALKPPVLDLDPTADATNGRYFIQRPQGGLGDGPAHIALSFAATGAANATFLAAGWGWSQLGKAGIWTPNKLFQITGTLGTLTGIASHGNIDDSWFFPDAISVTANNCPDGTCEAFGGTGADNGKVDLRFDPGQYPVIEIELADNGSATAVRCWRADQ